MASNPTGAVVEQGALFEVVAVIPPTTAGGTSYLEVPSFGGWVFNQGISGPWTGKPIVEWIGQSQAPEKGSFILKNPRIGSIRIEWTQGDTIMDMKRMLEQKYGLPVARQELRNANTGNLLGFDNTPLKMCTDAVSEVLLIDLFDERPSSAPASLEDTMLYDLLGISRNADKNDIKKAYYQRVRWFHPDLAGEKMSEDQLRSRLDAVKFAYEVLSDPARRQAYDKFGRQSLGLDGNRRR